jgi:hypothetical protein
MGLIYEETKREGKRVGTVRTVGKWTLQLWRQELGSLTRKEGVLLTYLGLYIHREHLIHVKESERKRKGC